MTTARVLAGEGLRAWGLLRRPAFTFQGRRLHYSVARHGHAWLSERTVELPLGIAAVEEARARGGRVLEVGNVLRNYGCAGHDVLDLFEQGEGVINEDVEHFQAPNPYWLVVSLSTMEHVGWDDPPRDPDKVFRALANLRRLVEPGGRILVTFPLGYHAGLDAALARRDPALGRVGFLKRVSLANRWTEASWDEVRGVAYGTPYICGNAVAVCEIRRDG